MSLTVQNVFSAHLPTFLKQYRLPGFLMYAAHAISRCRTAELGGHVHRCPEGHVERVWFNSCRHRACPQCGLLQVERWLQRQKSRVLGCTHFHIVFTISDQLDELWRMNSRLMTNILFRSARDTLFQQLGSNDRFFVGKPGIIAALHTWGRNLHLHPHLHCLVTGGGLAAAGDWIPVKNGFLLPFRKVRMEFRDRFIAALRIHLKRGDLVLPTGWKRERAERLLLRAGRKKWNVRLSEQYKHGNGVLTYLSRYICGGPISNRRLVSFENGKVTYRYFDHKDGKNKTLRLSVNDFMWRILQHVPEPGTQVVRHYGLYARQNKKDLETCRAFLGQRPIQEPNELSWQEYWKKWSGADPLVCPVCATRLLSTRLPARPRPRSAPMVDYRHAA